MKKKELKEKLEELLKSNQELARLNRMKSDFVSSVSHEIRTPLAIVKEGIRQIADNTLGAINRKQKRSLSIVLGSIERLEKIASNLLDISRIEVGKFEPMKKLADIAFLIERIIDEFQYVADLKKINLKYIRPKSKVNILIDPEMIGRAVSNLISNAIKFTKGGGSVKVRLLDKGDEILIEVKDTGVGIAKSNISRLFDKFTRFDNGTRRYGGSGLGLAITKGIIDLHRGNILVNSTLGRGSTFTVILPRLSSEDIFKEYITNGIKEVVNRESALSIIVLKLNNYTEIEKKLNSKSARDILVKLEEDIRKILRDGSDAFLRDTGECVILLFHTDRVGAFIVKRKIIDVIRNFMDIVQNRYNILIEVGIGVSTYPEEAKSGEELLTKARVRTKIVYIGPERRAHPRKLCTINVKILPETKGYQLETVDISTGGMCIFSNGYIRKGQNIEFTLELPQSLGEVKLKAKCIWVKKDEETGKYQVGFKFVKVDKDDLKTIEKFIEAG